MFWDVSEELITRMNVINNLKLNLFSPRERKKIEILIWLVTFSLAKLKKWFFLTLDQNILVDRI